MATFERNLQQKLIMNDPEFLRDVYRDFLREESLSSIANFK